MLSKNLLQLSGWVVVMGICAITVSVSRPAARQDPPYPPAIRPSHPTNAEASGTDLANPANAWDTSLSSGAGHSFNPICKSVCTTPSTRTTEWYGFAAGWIPRSLIIRWDASSGFYNIVAGSNGKVHAKLEYSLDGGGGWNTLYEFLSTNQAPQSNISTREDQISLSPDQDPTLVRVRASLTVQMTSCNNCTLSPSQATGTLYIRDIRMEVERPILTVSPEAVTRGQTAAFEVKGAPGGAISNWRYASERVGEIYRTTNLGQVTWSGSVADAGTATVSVQISGVTYNLSKYLAVLPRDFTLPTVNPSRVTGRELSCLGSTFLVPVPVTNAPHSLGMYCLELPAVRTAGYINDQGPNQDVRFVLSVSGAGTSYRWLINPDLDDVNCQFYTQQTGTYPRNPAGYISGEHLRANAVRHESGSEQSHYAQYVAANADPTKNIGVGVEDLVARGSSISATIFEADIDEVIANRRGLITAATNTPEPYGAERNAAGEFQGYINYTTYTGCHP